MELLNLVTIMKQLVANAGIRDELLRPYSNLPKKEAVSGFSENQIILGFWYSNTLCKIKYIKITLFFYNIRVTRSALTH